MKKALVIAAASLILVLSVTGCGCKNNNAGTSGGNSGAQDVEQNYSKNVDMDKVEGSQASSDTDKDVYKGKIGDTEVSIEDAKILDYENEKVAVVSFTFKNNGDEPVSFTSALEVMATQNDNKLPPAVVSDVEGVDMLSISDLVGKGQTITVQKAFKLRSQDVPFVVDVMPFTTDENSTIVEKTFNF